MDKCNSEDGAYTWIPGPAEGNIDYNYVGLSLCGGPRKDRYGGKAQYYAALDYEVFEVK